MKGNEYCITGILSRQRVNGRKKPPTAVSLTKSPSLSHILRFTHYIVQ
jgi:hypothetical protein